ncbi:MAG: radical SAM protein [Chloroflexota bacterium]|nr:radical SAM protein [Chloroflexota bacterium]
MQFDLPTSIPKHHNGVQCVLCSNECAIPDRERGYCGLRVVQDGKLTHLAGTPKYGLLHWYRDPLPTNCVAAWVCAGSEQKGHHNLSVFYQSCTANCLFCQNWNFREVSPEQSSKISALGLSQVANERTFCVCYFGGDPASQMPHALATSRVLSGQGVRICWETSGMAHPKLMDPAVRYSFDSGGCVKFDLKAYDDEIHQALTGVSNQRTLDNFARAGKRSLDRPEVPLVIASTLLVPGYVDREQVGKIAAFISSINPDIPYALLAFSPDFYMHDLGFTTTEQAREAERAAKEAGLTNVRVGNQHLLDWYY